MSLRFTTTHALVKSTATQPSYTTLTIMGWFYISTDENTFSLFWYANNSVDSQWISIDTGADGTTLNCDLAGGATSGTNLTVGKWYHICLTKAGSAHVVYLNGNVDITVTDAGTISGIDKFAFMNFPDSPFANHINGRIAAAKMWSGVALTRDEVRREMKQFAPVRTANLYGFYPCRTLIGYLFDNSGAGHSLTLSGAAPTQEMDPPIPWEVTRPRFKYVPAAAPGGQSVVPLLISQYRRR